jgi:hypothetical protein
MTMPFVNFKLSLFESPGDRVRSQRAILWLMEALTQINISWLKQHPETPTIYDSGVVYKFVPGEIDYWMDIPSIVRDGGADCEDLACWRVAELRHAGVNARPYIRWKKKNDSSYLYHALVWWPGGRIEDPSLALGMRGAIVRRPVFVEPSDDYT